MERAAAARTALVLDVDDLFNPLEMSRQRTTVGLARPLGTSWARLLPGLLSLGQSRLDFLQTELKLIGIDKQVWEGYQLLTQHINRHFDQPVLMVTVLD